MFIVSGTGGATYCAVASLRLMGFIEDDLLSKNGSSSIVNAPLLLDWILKVCFLQLIFEALQLCTEWLLFF